MLSANKTVTVYPYVVYAMSFYVTKELPIYLGQIH